MLRHVNQSVVVLTLILASVALTCTMPPNVGTLQGVVRGSSGEPVSGAFVKVSNAERGMTFMVVSQAQGRYSTPNLPPGKYTIEGIGGGYQSDAAGPVEVSSGQPATMDLVLSTPRQITPPAKRMTSADYAKLMPEDDGKTLLASRCVICHGLERVVPTRKTQEEWQESVERMRGYMLDQRMPLSDQERDLMVNYLAQHFGPDVPNLPREADPTPDPNRHFPRTLLKGAVAKYVAMEFNLQPGVNPHDIAVDSRGIAWVSERTGHIGRYEPNSHAYTRFATPAGKFPHRLNAIAVDPQDEIWTMDNGRNARMVHYNPKSGEFNTYPIPPPPNEGGAGINTIRFLDGNVWGTGISSSRIVKLDPNTGKVTAYPVPRGSHPYGLAIGGENMIWYAAHYSDEVVKLDPNTGKLSRYRVPTPKSDLRRMAADAEGNLWVGAHEAGKVVKVDHRTGKITEYPTPTEDSGPYGMDVDAKRNLIWIDEHYADQIARFDPRTNSFVEFPLPSAGSDVRRVEIDRSHRNRVWWSGSGADKIGYIEVIE